MSSTTEKSYKELLHSITTFVFDIDGVFTDSNVFIMPDGELVRRINSRDGYAVQLAVKNGYQIVVITGGKSEAVKKSLSNLGVHHVFLASSNKEEVFDAFVAEHNLSREEILYMGDDIPDYKVMLKSAVATCPADAAEEIKAICHYVTVKKGGEGCVREIIEQVMKLQGKWLKDDAFHW